MIKIKNVSFSYDKNEKSIDNLSLDIKKGEFVVLCGKSGCGKTTVTRLINGLIPHFHEGIFEGEVIVDEKNIAKIELSDLSSTCGSMFQNPKSQFFNIDTTSELAFGCENLALSNDEIIDRITNTTDELELSKLIDRNIFELSGGEKHVLSIKDLAFKENSVVAIIGENGAGKSTFIDCVSGFLPSRNEIYLGNRNMNEKDRLNKSFVVMQDVNRQLFCSSVLDEISLKSEKSEQEIAKLMKDLDIYDLKYRHPASLSGGQKQRVAICSAFASNTELMFYDEPTSGLDFKGMKSFCKLVCENYENHKITFIITHDLELILGCCTHVLHLEKDQHIESYALDDDGKNKLSDFFIRRKSKMDSINELKRKKQPLLKSLLAYSGNYKPFMYLGLVLSGISAILALLPVVFIWLGVSEIFEMYPNFELSQNLLNYAYLAVGSAVSGIFVYGCGLMCTHAVAFRVARNMKSNSIKKLMDLPLGYFNSTGSGKIKRTLSETIAKTESYLAHQMPDMIGAFVTPLAVLYFVFTYNWKLGLISIIPLALSCGAMMLMMNSGTAERLRQYQTSLDKMNNEAVEYVRGISVVKTFGQSIFSFEKFHKTILEYKEFVVGYTIMCRNPMVAFQTLLACVSLFLVFGAIAIFSVTDDTKTFMLDFLFYLFFTPIYSFMMMRLMWVSQNTQLASDALDRTEDLINERTLIYKNQTQKPQNFDILFKNVSFAYPNAMKNALENVNLEIKQGQTVALVGGSGGGKSTLATLIPRFWDVSEGSVSIGGIDVRDMSESDIMDSISFVFQNTNLYKMSILDNVREGKPNASEIEVLEALKLARCEEIIEKLPNGIYTEVGKNGVYLSGGEAQRIAIARAILKNSPIILLDEATAFTDPENEHEIQLAMEKLAQNKTVLMIAHRLSTVQNADKIYHIDNAKIIEQGTHGELLEQKGKFFDMWQEYNNAFLWNESEVRG